MTYLHNHRVVRVFIYYLSGIVFLVGGYLAANLPLSNWWGTILAAVALVALVAPFVVAEAAKPQVDQEL